MRRLLVFALLLLSGCSVLGAPQPTPTLYVIPTQPGPTDTPLPTQVLPTIVPYISNTPSATPPQEPTKTPLPTATRLGTSAPTHPPTQVTVPTVGKLPTAQPTAAQGGSPSSGVPADVAAYVAAYSAVTSEIQTGLYELEDLNADMAGHTQNADWQASLQSTIDRFKAAEAAMIAIVPPASMSGYHSRAVTYAGECATYSELFKDRVDPNGNTNIQQVIQAQSDCVAHFSNLNNDIRILLSSYQ